MYLWRLPGLRFGDCWGTRVHLIYAENREVERWAIHWGLVGETPREIEKKDAYFWDLSPKERADKHVIGMPPNRG